MPWPEPPQLVQPLRVIMILILVIYLYCQLLMYMVNSYRWFWFWFSQTPFRGCSILCLFLWYFLMVTTHSSLPWMSVRMQISCHNQIPAKDLYNICITADTTLIPFSVPTLPPLKNKTPRSLNSSVWGTADCLFRRMLVVAPINIGVSHKSASCFNDL